MVNVGGGVHKKKDCVALPKNIASANMPAVANSAAVLDYQRLTPGAPARRARALRIAMLIVAILAVHLAAVLILHPAFEVSEVQTYLGGGVIGTPFSPINVPVPDGGHGR